MTEETALQTLDDIANTNIEVPAALIHELAKIIRKNALEKEDLQRRLRDSHSENTRKDGELKKMRRQLSVVPLERRVLHSRENYERASGRTTEAVGNLRNDAKLLMIVHNYNAKRSLMYLTSTNQYNRIFTLDDLVNEKLMGLQRTEIVVLPEMFTTGFSMQPALFAETIGKTKEAIEFLQRIKEEFPKNSHANDVDKYLARLGVNS